MSNIELISKTDEMEEVGSIVRESIDQTMKDLLGEQGAKATFFHIGLTDYDTETHEFHLRMFSIFSGGTPTIERMIIKDLFKRVDIPFLEGTEFDYERSVKYALKVAHDRVVKSRRSLF